MFDNLFSDKNEANIKQYLKWKTIIFLLLWIKQVYVKVK